MLRRAPHSRARRPASLFALPVFHSRTDRPEPSGDRALFRDHADRVARTLLEADRAARAQVVDVLVAFTGPELGDRVLGAGTVAAVTLKAVAAGKAALRLVDGFLIVQPMHHLFESGAAPLHLRTRLRPLPDVGVVPQVQLVERGEVFLRRLAVALAAQKRVDVVGGLLAVTDADGDGALRRHHVAAGEETGIAGHHLRRHDHRAVVLELDAGDLAQERRVGVLTEGEDQVVGFQRLQLSRRPRPTLLVDLHDLDGEGGRVDRLDGPQPVDHDAFLQRLVRFELVRRHLRPGAPIDDHRLVAEAHGDAGGVHCRIAAAVDGDLAAELGRIAHLDVLEEADRVEDLAGVAGGDVGLLREVCAHGDEHRVELASLFFADDVLDLVIEHDLHARSLDALNLAVEDVARQPVGGDAEVHHAACDRAGLVDLHGMAHQRQMMRARQTAGAGADDQDAFAGGRRGDRRRPLLGERLVSEKPLDRVDGDRRVELAAVAVRLARVIADAAVHRRQRIVLEDGLPRFAETAGGGMREPGLDVFAGGTGVVAGWEEVEIDRPLRAHVADRPRHAEVRWTGQIGGLTARTGGLFTHRARPPPNWPVGVLLRLFGRSRVAPETPGSPLSPWRRAARAPALMRPLPRHYRSKPMRKRIRASKQPIRHRAHVRWAVVRPMRVTPARG